LRGRRQGSAELVETVVEQYFAQRLAQLREAALHDEAVPRVPDIVW